MSTFTCAYIGNLAVIVHGKASPSDDEWNRQLDELRSMGNADRYKVLVYSEGGGPSPRQRQGLLELFGEAKTRTAIVTTSATMRGVSTALRWFNPEIRPFPPQKLQDAFDHLELTREERIRAQALLHKLMGYLGLKPDPSWDPGGVPARG